MPEKEMSQLIWISCLGAERTLGSLGKEWNYSSPVTFYRGNYIEELKDLNMIEINKKKSEKSGREEKFNHSIFDGYPSVLKSIITEKDQRILEESKKDILDFLDRDIVRKNFFSLKKLKILFNEDPNLGKKYGYQVPFIVYVISCSLKYLADTLDLFEKGFKGQTLQLGLLGSSGLFSMMSPDLNSSGYFSKTLGELNEEQLKELLDGYFEGTKAYKNAGEQFGEFKKLLGDTLNF